MTPRPMTELELCRWLDEQSSAVSHRWGVELRARSGRDEGVLETLRDDLLDALVEFLSPAVGPWRDEVEPLLQQLAALYGNVASLRGLAAGDVVEETQLLREVLLRFLFRDLPPGDSEVVVGVREFLRLNRVVDQVVTHANVGHIDALFFNLLHGTGVTEAPADERLEELARELALLREELEEMRPLEETSAPVPRN